MDLITEFINQYNKQYDFYSELARIGNGKLESELGKRGIKAIVSYRAKNPNRLKDKLLQRIEKKKYNNIQDIYDDMVDLAGVRVALYFPSDRDLVDEIVKELFKIKKIKKFPESSHDPKYTKRFSGYWATHYRVSVKDVDKGKERYHNSLFEIQVASVLMHAWSEVEHDLVYKPLSGSLSEEELAILDEINGLVITGEIALERLQKAITKRSKESKEINDRYEMTSFIVNSLGKNYINKLKLGNTSSINNYISSTSKIDPETLSKYLENVNQSVDETISDQLLSMIMREFYKDNINDKSLSNYFASILGPNKDTSGFELFVKTWIVLEKAVQTINYENNIIHKKYFVPNFKFLVARGLLDHQEGEELSVFRQIRNQMLHGIETPPDKYLNKAYSRLRLLTIKIIEQIKNEEQRAQLLGEINEMA
jgi:ppGpp synthetase/RelA/SpoT-type nucleotidyltranferase